jgi:hypothetical protein
MAYGAIPTVLEPAAAPQRRTIAEVIAASPGYVPVLHVDVYVTLGAPVHRQRAVRERRWAGQGALLHRLRTVHADGRPGGEHGADRPDRDRVADVHPPVQPRPLPRQSGPPGGGRIGWEAPWRRAPAPHTTAGSACRRRSATRGCRAVDLASELWDAFDDDPAVADREAGASALPEKVHPVKVTGLGRGSRYRIHYGLVVHRGVTCAASWPSSTAVWATCIWQAPRNSQPT